MDFNDLLVARGAGAVLNMIDSAPVFVVVVDDPAASSGGHPQIRPRRQRRPRAQPARSRREARRRPRQTGPSSEWPIQIVKLGCEFWAAKVRAVGDAD
jgi:hypothetical protein